LGRAQTLSVVIEFGLESDGIDLIQLGEQIREFLIEIDRSAVVSIDNNMLAMKVS